MMSAEDEKYRVGRRMSESASQQPEHGRPAERVPADRMPADRLPADRLPADAVQQDEAAGAEARPREITVIERDRIVAQLQDKVIQRVFRAGLTLQGAARLTTDPEIRRLIQAATDELDHVIREVRGAVFGHEQRGDGRGLREKIIELSSRLVTAADISFIGPPDGTLDAATSAWLLETLRQALALIGEYATPTRVDITAGDNAHDIVIEAVPLGPHAGDPAARFDGLQARAEQAGIPVDIEFVPGGTRFTWHAALASGE
jgi:two-component system, NarL family, sensor histidine kinase DevS